jgi:hypothetical protein
MPSLTATYAVPGAAPKVFSSALPGLSTPPTTSARTAYLSTLSTSVRTLQDDLNAFLTQKMADDKAAGDDAKAEEAYGEEIVDED